MTQPLLEIRSLRAAYGKIEALKGVDLDIKPGEIVALIGANGAGKSTLMMTIFGKPRARSGQILFDGRDITEVPTHQIARLRIAQSPEGRRIFPRMSVAENLQMGADATDSSEAERTAGLERVLTLFPRLKERITQRGGTLSGGKAKSSSGCPSGSRNLKAVTPPDVAGNRWGPSVEMAVHPVTADSCRKAASTSDTASAKC